ncbi:MAG: peptidyl-prolyl cis-trans isomerase cyclophilin type [Gemmatimonadetes bacterium]|jgi:peptidyl-prolyl cis-trans isomerase A (cyclophilin A)|nr:peptidyl-prolyl cis-trans isomerase cyclophilin type [Gemmatimonadota bacterium]
MRLGVAVAALSLVAASVLGAQSPAAAPLTAAQRRAALLDPTKSVWSARAPATVTADIETTRGTITIELVREWAPAGVDRFYNLARAGYYDDSRFYRVIYGYIAQFGIAGDPRVADIWGRRKIPADKVREHNVRGTLSYAQFKPTDRTTNVFINLRDNPQLDTLRFSPFARVVQGMDVVDSLYAFYGEFPAAEAPLGNPKRLYGESNKYLDEKFPLLDKIVKITIRPE